MLAAIINDMKQPATDISKVKDELDSLRTTSQQSSKNMEEIITNEM